MCGNIVIIFEQEIKSYLYRASTKMKFHASHFDVLSVPGQSSVMLTVDGTIKSADNKPRSFVETFVLDIPGRLILRDSLVVQENGNILFLFNIKPHSFSWFDP